MTTQEERDCIEWEEGWARRDAKKLKAYKVFVIGDEENCAYI